MYHEPLPMEGPIDFCLRREREERLAFLAAKDANMRDKHFMAAERFADQAWSLTEASEGSYLRSGLWDLALATHRPPPSTPA